MKPRRKLVTGVQAQALAQLAMLGTLERTLDQGVQLNVRFIPAYMPGRLGEANVIVKRDGGMRSTLPSVHPLRAVRRERLSQLKVAA